jgi:XisH protein
MSGRDVYHDVVKTALIKDGWKVTADPLTLKFSTRYKLQIDLAAEALVAAEKDNQFIAVEVKSFLAPSAVSEFHTALGQLINYRIALRLKQPERECCIWRCRCSPMKSFSWKKLSGSALQKMQ